MPFTCLLGLVHSFCGWVLSWAVPFSTDYFDDLTTRSLVPGENRNRSCSANVQIFESHFRCIQYSTLHRRSRLLYS